jgi:phosphoribosylaminoimidazole-succinocarboxamide synthase
MSQIGKTWFPYFKDSDPAVSEVQAVEAINRMVVETGVRVINIETVYRNNWFGRAVEPCGHRVWWEGEPTPTVAESLQQLFDQVNS